MKKYFIVLVANLFILASCKQEEIKLGLVGDILLDRGVRAQLGKMGYPAFYDQIAVEIPELDYLVGNLECPITQHQEPVYKKYVFRADTENLAYLNKLGFTHLVLANNHSYDQGRYGLQETHQGLARNNIKTIGYGENSEQACSPVLIQKNNISIALFASVNLKLENWMPLNDTNCICQEDEEKLIKRISDYRKTHKKHYILVSLHWGIEHSVTKSPMQKQLAQNLIDAGADVIFGHHPHVIQQTEYYKGKPIFYSLGNFIFDQKKKINSQSKLIVLQIGKKGIHVEELPYEIKNCIPYLKKQLRESSHNQNGQSSPISSAGSVGKSA